MLDDSKYLTRSVSMSTGMNCNNADSTYSAMAYHTLQYPKAFHSTLARPGFFCLYVLPPALFHCLFVAFGGNAPTLAACAAFSLSLIPFTRATSAVQSVRTFS